MRHLHGVANTLHVTCCLRWLRTEYPADTNPEQMTDWRIEETEYILRIKSLNLLVWRSLRAAHLVWMHGNCRWVGFVRFALSTLSVVKLFCRDLFSRRHNEMQALDCRRPDGIGLLIFSRRRKQKWIRVIIQKHSFYTSGTLPMRMISGRPLTSWKTNWLKTTQTVDTTPKCIVN